MAMDDIVVYARWEDNRAIIGQVEKKDFVLTPETVYYIIVPESERDKIDMSAIQFVEFAGIKFKTRIAVPIAFVGVASFSNGKMFIQHPTGICLMLNPENVPSFFVIPPPSSE